MGKVFCDFCFWYLFIFYVKQYISYVSIKLDVCHMHAYLLCSQGPSELELRELLYCGDAACPFWVGVLNPS